MMNRLIVIAVLALVFAGTSAHAKGMYFSGNLGLSIVPDLDQEISGSQVTSISFDKGFRISGAWGYDFEGFRVEGEIGYRTNDADQGTLFPITGFMSTENVEGDFSVLSLMGNGYYDFHSANSRLVPYVGVGLGVASIDADIRTNNPIFAGQQIVNDSVAAFAIQFMAGLGFNVSPTTTLTFDYRYFASYPTFELGNFWVSEGALAYESDYINHSFNVGARFAF